MKESTELMTKLNAFDEAVKGVDGVAHTARSVPAIPLRGKSELNMQSLPLQSG